MKAAKTSLDEPLAIGPIEADVDAPAALVYQMLVAIGQGPASDGERAEIIASDGDRLVCEFQTLVQVPIGGPRLVRTREEVTLRPPDAIEYRHLDGPLRDLREVITAREISPRRTRLTYSAVYRPRSALHRLGFRLGRRLIEGTIERTIERHFADLRRRAETRAARSRLFPAASDARPEVDRTPGEGDRAGRLP